MQVLTRRKPSKLLLDVRLGRECAEGHIPGTMNWPVVSIEEYAAEDFRGRENFIDRLVGD